MALKFFGDFYALVYYVLMSDGLNAVKPQILHKGVLMLSLGLEMRQNMMDTTHVDTNQLAIFPLSNSSLPI